MAACHQSVGFFASAKGYQDTDHPRPVRFSLAAVVSSALCIHLFRADLLLSHSLLRILFIKF